MSELLLKVIQRLLDCGLHVKAIICDQGTNNVAALKLLKVTKDKPFFEVNERRIYSIFDAPHLFKNLRNHLKKTILYLKAKNLLFKT